MHLAVMSGPAAGSRVDLGERFVVGRDEGCDLVLDDPKVSRRHAVVERLPDGRYALLDLGSANGTWVGGARIGLPVVLQGGEDVRVGDTLLAVVAAAPAARPGAVRPRVAIGVAACALAGLGTAIGLVLGGKEAPPGYTPDPASARIAAFAQSGASPTAAEGALLAHVPAAIQVGGCWRPASEIGSLPGAVTAVGCDAPGGIALVYWQFRSGEEMNEWYGNVAGALAVPRGRGICPTDEEAEQEWRVADVVGGHTVCSDLDGRRVIAWTSDEQAIGVTLSAPEADEAARKLLAEVYYQAGPE